VQSCPCFNVLKALSFFRVSTARQCTQLLVIMSGSDQLSVSTKGVVQNYGEFRYHVLLIAMNAPKS
jgi:hypothetical protein